MLPLVFLASPLGRKVAAGALVVVLAAGALWLYGKRQREAGRQKEAIAQVEADRRLMEMERSAKDRALADAKEREQQAVERERQYQAALETATRALAAVRVERSTGRERVSALPDSSLQSDITGKLGIRLPADASPGFHPQELRKVSEVLTDYPLLARENKLLGEKVEAVAGQVQSLTQRVQAVEQQRDAWSQWAFQVEGHYVRAYNALPHKGNFFLRVVTFGLKGKPKRLDLPAPADLARGRPGVK